MLEEEEKEPPLLVDMRNLREILPLLDPDSDSDYEFDNLAGR